MTTEPYVGPRHFTEDDKNIFFGRDREADELTAMIVCNSLCVLYAQSGVGKSSLVRAGILPNLNKEHFVNIGVARLASVTHAARNDGDARRTNPFTAALIESLRLGESPDSTTLSDFLAKTLRGHLEKNRGPSGELREDLRGLLVIDQFEELFAARPDLWAQRDAFLEEVSVALRANPRAAILICIREEFLAHISGLGRLLIGLGMAWYRLDRLTREAAQQAIECPLKSTNVEYTPEALDSLLKMLFRLAPGPDQNRGEAFGEFAEPLHLQVVCKGLWNSRREGERFITAERVNECGDIDTALESYYDDSLREISRATTVKEGRIRVWVERHLITHGGTRALILNSTTPVRTLGQPVLDALLEHYLVREERRGRDTWYELAHDRLVSAIQQSNLRWREAIGIRNLWQKLEDQANKWNANQDRELLLRGAELQAARNLVTQLDVGKYELSPALSELVERSIAAEQEKHKEFRRRIYVSIGILVGVMVAAAVWYQVFAEGRTATYNAYISIVDGISSDPVKTPLAMAFALRAYGVSMRPGQKAEATKRMTRMLDTRGRNPRLGPLEYTWTEISPNGKLLATYGLQDLYVWELPEGRPLLHISNYVRDVQFSDTADHVAVTTTVGNAARVYVFPLGRDPQATQQSWSHECLLFDDNAGCAVFTSNFKYVALRHDASTVRVINVAENRIVRDLPVTGAVTAVSFSPDEESIVIAEPANERNRNVTRVNWYSLRSDTLFGTGGLDLGLAGIVLWDLASDRSVPTIVDGNGGRAFKYPAEEGKGRKWVEVTGLPVIDPWIGGINASYRPAKEILVLTCEEQMSRFGHFHNNCPPESDLVLGVWSGGRLQASVPIHDVNVSEVVAISKEHIITRAADGYLVIHPTHGEVEGRTISPVTTGELRVVSDGCRSLRYRPAATFLNAKAQEVCEDLLGKTGFTEQDFPWLRSAVVFDKAVPSRGLNTTY